MRKLGRGLALFVTVALMAAVPAGCGLNEDAVNTANSYVVAVLSDEREAIPQEITTEYDSQYWKRDAADEVLKRAVAKLDEDKSDVSKNEDAGSIFYDVTMPDVEALLLDSPVSFEDLVSRLDSVSTVTKEVEIKMSYRNGEWSVSNKKEIYDLLYGEIYSNEMRFLYPTDKCISNVILSGTDNGELSLTDSGTVKGIVIFDDMYLENGVTPDLMLELYENGKLLSAEFTISEDAGAGGYSFELNSTAIDPKLRYFRQGDYELKVYNHGSEAFSLPFKIFISSQVFSNQDAYVFTEWLGVDMSGGYYNVDRLEAKVHLDYDYLMSGRDLFVTFNVFKDGEQFALSQNSVFDGRDCLCTYISEDGNLDTGLYKFVIYNNGTLVGNSEVMVTHNFNEKAYSELDIASVTDEPEDPESTKEEPVVIYMAGTTDSDVFKKYTDVEYKIVSYDLNTFEHTLDAALASGDNSPDLFVVGADYVSKYANNDSVLPINDLGISYSELKYMYEYTFRLATDKNGVIKGLTWQITPGGVFYNKNVALSVLGVSDPEDVQRFFMSWDAFEDTCSAVDEISGGKVKIAASIADIQIPYMRGRMDPWTDSENVYVPDYMASYFDLASFLLDGEMTFNSSRWSNEWTGHMNDKKVLTYWGTLKFGDVFLKNTYSGKWGLIKGPVYYFDGGSWIFSTDQNNMRASSAQIIRDLTMDQDNLLSMAKNGDTVNAINIMNAASEDDSFNRSWLDDQNPYGIFGDIAWQMNVDAIGSDDKAINDVFSCVVSDYLDGNIASSQAAQNAFIKRVEELGIL